jgi:small subunit ribosomal protein S16
MGGCVTKKCPQSTLAFIWLHAIVRVHFGGFSRRLFVPAATDGANEPMAVKIRLKRIGAKNDPAYRLVVADSRSPRDGRFIEELGTYLPAREGQTFQVNLERANYWLSKGAQPSETVASLLKQAAKAETATAPAE